MRGPVVLPSPSVEFASDFLARLGRLVARVHSARERQEGAGRARLLGIGSEFVGYRAYASGDRYRPLGAPGSKALARFLAERGVAREDRAHVPLVLERGRILWVAGFAPCEERRVHAGSEVRLRLALHA